MGSGKEKPADDLSSQDSAIGSKEADMKYPSIARLAPQGRARKIHSPLGDIASERHDLQYFEMFCNVGAGKANRFNGNINWVLKPEPCTSSDADRVWSGEERTPGY